MSRETGTETGKNNIRRGSDLECFPLTSRNESAILKKVILRMTRENDDGEALFLLFAERGVPAENVLWEGSEVPPRSARKPSGFGY